MTVRVLAVHFTPPGVIGGVEHVLQRHVELLRGHGFEVQVIAGRASDAMPDVQVIPDLDAARPEGAALERELMAGAAGPGFQAACERVARGLRPLAESTDYVLAHNAFTLHFSLPLTAALWQIAAGRPPGSVIAWCHDLSWANPLYLPGMHPGYPWDLLRVRAPKVRYVTVSEERRRELLALWHGRGSEWVDVISNGIDPEPFLRLGPEVASIARAWRLFDRDAILLLPVRITRRKNIELGIRTLAALRQAGVDAVFLVSGPQAPHHPGRSSDYLGDLRELARVLGVERECVFLAATLGHTLDESGVRELYLLADLLFFPSMQEGFGLPILEAGLARLPVVVSDIPVFREVAGGEATYVALDQSPETIAETVIELLRAPSAALRRHVLREYRWEAIFRESMLPLFARTSETGDA